MEVSRRAEKLAESGREGSKRGREVERTENVVAKDDDDDDDDDEKASPFLANVGAAASLSVLASHEESTAPVRPSMSRKARRGYANAMLLRQLRAWDRSADAAGAVAVLEDDRLAPPPPPLPPLPLPVVRS